MLVDLCQSAGVILTSVMELTICFEQKFVRGEHSMLYTEIMNDNKDFMTLYKKGRYAASKYSVIYVRPNGRPFNRLGITAGKKVGNAVCRNRAKRLIRLAYRQSEVDMPVGMDIVIVARTALIEIKSQEYCGYMEKYGVADINRMFRKFQSPSKKA